MSRIRIVGAGVAGLALAAFLAPARHDVELVDERFAVPEVSTAFCIWPRTRRLLAARGLEAPLVARGVEVRGGALRVADGRGLPVSARSPALFVPRSALVEVLARAIPETVLRRTERIDAPAPEAGIDVLVGADGVGSRTRTTAWGPAHDARSHGRTVLRGIVDLPAPAGAIETWGRGWLMGVTPLDGRRTNWFACFDERRFPDADAALAHLRELVGGRLDDLDRVLAAADPAATLVHGIRSVARPVLPVRGNTVLIGDAAHAMTPNLGRGACTAIDDAAVLARELDSRAPQAALRRYARRRTVVPHAIRIASAAMLGIATTTRGAGVRDALVGARGRAQVRSAGAVRGAR
ncbi:NAD(P)-binding protein [Pseudoclavibacter chungangensis]|uniref:NAD(P)-binding protein n=1 Tax=Pseudoclavibacter chungangensis TaxID=587635 RepID=A0A7J5C477_9MICO|nr:FAD-dependent monooxygenase [Pseudoclavibacter chungangensis]KAB1662590.1 NAD(P)-binding protein [Pseudoclavibacter chungangensis]NYJ68638.1 2-polyprenyl-6-methoxyphenol hydroxylase-like FAD-dependent oxidoreductase [Pseudoclavibacter chungangensis]